MDQKAILRLLEEAVTARGSRVIEIHNVLSKHVFGSDPAEAEEDSRGGGLQVLLDELYVGTLQQDPRLLPGLFPAFAILCGDRTSAIIAEVDWSVYETRQPAKAAPAIYRFSALPWGWVLLEELAEILGIKPSDLLERYGALSKDASVGVMAVTTGEVLENISISNLVSISKDREEGVESAFGGTFYVPAGWSNDVIKAAADGYTSVTLERMYLDDETSDPSWLTISHNTGFDNEFWVAVGHKG